MILPERTLVPEEAEAWIRECLRIGPDGVWMTVKGSCMEPALSHGSTINLRAPAKAARIGDVVLLRTSLGLRLHRVLFRFRGTIRTKGDRGISLDPSSSKDAVIAVWDSNESFPKKALNAGRSLIRLLVGSRFERGDARLGDAGHDGLLP